MVFSYDYRLGQRRQSPFDTIADRFEPGRQLQALTQFGLVDKNSRPVCRDLEQNAARFPKINRAEILAIDHARDAKTGFGEFRSPLKLLRFARDTPCDVMHGSRAHAARLDTRHRDDVQRRPGQIETASVAFARNILESERLQRSEGALRMCLA